MKVSEWITNLTEVQDRSWLNNWEKEEVEEKWLKNRFFVWQKIKLIKEAETIIELEEFVRKISIVEVDNHTTYPYEKRFNIHPQNGNRMVAKWKKQIWDNPFLFFDLFTSIVSKRKVTFFTQPKRKKKEYDYEFLQLLSKDLEESIIHCEEYYDILSEIGELENYKVELFKKYGIEYNSNKEEVEELIEQRDISDIQPHPSNNQIYQKQFENLEKLEKSIKQYGQLEPIVITSENTIISGHRRFKVLKNLGYKVVNVRVRDFENEI